MAKKNTDIQLKFIRIFFFSIFTFPNLTASSSICCANSRVGAKISAYGPLSASSDLSVFGNDRIQASKGIRNAKINIQIFIYK